MTRSDYIRIGARHGSDRIALEADETLAQWQRDLPQLAGYGFGPRALETFRDLMQRHQELRRTRSGSIANRREFSARMNQTVEEAWELAKRIHSILTPVARENTACAEHLRAHYPADDLQLDKSLPALGALLAENRPHLDADLDVDAIARRAQELSAALSELRGTKPDVSGRPQGDTLDIDELDGRLYVTMLDVNRAGRRLMKAGLIPERPPFYRFTHLHHRPASAVSPTVPPSN